MPDSVQGSLQNRSICMDAASVGYRFHPNEEELINHFLVLKLSGHDDLVDDDIGEIDVFRREPSDLPDFARVRSNDPVWYFFCHLEKKYSNGKRVNRRTTHGVWKITGTVREIKARGTKEVIGTQKKMVFYRKVLGSKDIKTDWVIHEYQHISTRDDPTALVVCKLKKKANAGVSLGDEGEADFFAASDAGVSLGDEGEAGFFAASDFGNPTAQPTILQVDPDELQLRFVGGDTVDFPLSFESRQGIRPEFSDDEDQVDPITFVDSLWNEDEIDNYLCNSISERQPSKPFSNSSEGQTSTSQHRQMKANNGDDILIMGAGPVNSSRVSHVEINSIEELGEEFPRVVAQAQHSIEKRREEFARDVAQAQILTFIPKGVSFLKGRDRLQMDSTVLSKEFFLQGKEVAKHDATKYGKTIGIQEIDGEIPKTRKPQQQARLDSGIRKPQRQLKFTSNEAGQEGKQGAPVDLTRNDSLTMESGKEKKMPRIRTSKPDLSSEDSTSNDQKGTIIRPKPPLRHNPCPLLVYLTNAVIGLIWGVIILWDMLRR